ncbi:Scd6-like Sm domain-domain-containing protein [Absidia repens]|uniref:Scd6-like Sm domain-domain-containing protein n=1 Tax=Absidia repens TaxID=90262 RepID=A0A1X2I961_9FUNG|nr:Scd6-like Sm domain-domain-containing protein [Absidia repens]
MCQVTGLDFDSDWLTNGKSQERKNADCTLLISKSDIRYIGTLRNVDTQTSSIALGQGKSFSLFLYCALLVLFTRYISPLVQSFGTEGRRGGRFQDEIPPSDSVFEYIVFRGADIKDLQVFEAPPPPLAPQAYAFPQYVAPQSYPYSYSMPLPSYGCTIPNQHYAMYPPPPLNAPLLPTPPFPSQLTTTMSVMTQKPEATDDVTPDTTFSPTTLVPDTVTKVRTPLVDDDDNSHLTISKPDTKDSPSPSPRTSPDTLVTTSFTELDGVTRLINDLDIGDKGRSSRDGTTESEPLKTNSNNNNNSKMIANTKPNNSGSRNGRRKSKSKKTNAANIPTLQQEFDFASSNAKFNKDTSQTSNLSVDAFYDKKKSFFDNISCDAKEKTESAFINKDYRKKHKDEKQLNLETFGPSSIHLPRRKQTRQGGRTNSIRRNNGKQATSPW